MNKMSCDVCMDLIPLVKDDIANSGSRLFVEEHIKTCEACNIIYMGKEQIEIKMDDSAVVNKIKRQISNFLIAIILIGTVFGMMITNSIDMFYNALIMPIIGAIGYILLKEKAILLTVCLFIFSSIWHIVQLFSSGGSRERFVDIVLAAMFYSAIYALFSLIGIFIAWLLKYAFGRDNK